MRVTDMNGMGRIVVIDSTLFESYYRDRKNGMNFDPDAKWGYRAMDDSWVFGYKLHIACDAESELPLAYTVTPANVHDSTQYLSLLADLRALGIEPKVVVADKGYDSKANILTTIDRYNAAPIIAMNRRRAKKKERDFEKNLPIKRDSKIWKDLYKERSSVERIFSRLQNETDMEEVTVRGLENVKIHVTLSMIAMLVVALVALMTGNEDRSRRIKSFRY